MLGILAIDTTLLFVNNFGIMDASLPKMEKFLGTGDSSQLAKQLYLYHSIQAESRLKLSWEEVVAL